METVVAALERLPRGALIGLLVLACIQLIFQAWCLIDLIRRPSVLGGRKWLWALVIICAGLLGALLYMGMGRLTNMDLGPDRGAGGDHATRRAVDKLYGDKQ